MFIRTGLVSIDYYMTVKKNSLRNRAIHLYEIISCHSEKDENFQPCLFDTFLKFILNIVSHTSFFSFIFYLFKNLQINNTVCRCNLWGTNCRCHRMGLFQKIGKK
ncbi:hypothetical protein DERP_001423 [Dermatophagoides pteronyssinus]|uniref:Uncharacterized protein n=1 Tax=Dermatophagoides pteronyssinus TaxID=6956 RepID=A0ABQ8JEG4_DERPT|nr:hypothetical protein DERP_001423 [Dermatophagoides pteronyssinus]